MTNNSMNSLERITTKMLSERPFFGILMQQINTVFTERVPTLGITFSKETKKFVMYINKKFLNSLSLDEAVAVLLHELHHILYKHVFYNVEKHDLKRWNIAMDISVNQRIVNLPKEAIFLENFKDKNGKPFPKNLLTEEYYDLLDGATYEDESGNSYEVNDITEFDEHDWTDAHESEKKEAAKEIIKRALEKTEKMFSSTETHKDISLAKSVIDAIQSQNKKEQYKQALSYAIKRSLPSRDRTHTWTKPSKRFGYQSPGSKYHYEPKIDVYFDTSGSISVKLFEEFMQYLNGLIRYLNTKVTVNFFNTSVYYSTVMKKNEKIDYERIEIGGTDLTDVIKKINERASDLAVILTDGYYSDVQEKTHNKIVFVITKDGCVNHPLARLGMTVQMA